MNDMKVENTREKCIIYYLKCLIFLDVIIYVRLSKSTLARSRQNIFQASPINYSIYQERKEEVP